VNHHGDIPRALFLWRDLRKVPHRWECSREHVHHLKGHPARLQRPIGDTAPQRVGRGAMPTADRAGAPSAACVDRPMVNLGAWRDVENVPGEVTQRKGFASGG
jgi:hypothetical protein